MSAPVRLLYVIDEYRNPNAGTERQLYRLISGLDRRRFAPELAVLRGSEYIDSGAFPCPVHQWDVRKIASVATLVSMSRLASDCRNKGFRVVHAFFNDAAVLVPFFFRRAGLKVLSSRRDMGFWYNGPTLTALRLMARFTDSVIANSDAVAKNVEQQERVPRSKISVIYNGVEGPKSDASPSPEHAATLSRLEGKRVVGIVANIRPVKRVQDLAIAFESIAMKVPDSVLLIVGGGDRESIESRARAAGIGERVIFTGQVSSPDALIARFDVAVLCSESEGLSNSIIEYMLHGKPVVATRTGGNPELVEEGVTGRLVPVGATDALSARITELLTDENTAERFGAEARRRALTRFEMHSMISAHESLYEKLLHS
jgi:glycosyltransferase involved in cell wall biosynthesis